MIDLETSLVPQFRANFEELKKYLVNCQTENKNIWISTASEAEIRDKLSDISLQNISFYAPLALDPMIIWCILNTELVSF